MATITAKLESQLGGRGGKLAWRQLHPNWKITMAVDNQIEIIGDGQASNIADGGPRGKHHPDVDGREKLPIQLFPEDEAQFKRELLCARRAVITTYFADGRITKKTWIANRFQDTSGVGNNLRSRFEFRCGIWQQRGIERVEVRITNGGNDNGCTR